MEAGFHINVRASRHARPQANSTVSEIEGRVRQQGKVALRTLGIDGTPVIRTTERVLFAGDMRGRLLGYCCFTVSNEAFVIQRDYCLFQKKKIQTKTSAHRPLSVFPTSNSYFYFGNASLRPLVFLRLFSGRLSLWEGI